MDAFAPVFTLLAQAGLALVFLLLGWRFGRESAGRAMFDHPMRERPGQETPEEADPWTEAALGPCAGRPDVDSFASPGSGLPSDTEDKLN